MKINPYMKQIAAKRLGVEVSAVPSDLKGIRAAITAKKEKTPPKLLLALKPKGGD
jgi:hypothetical protein